MNRTLLAGLVLTAAALTGCTEAVGGNRAPEGAVLETFVDEPGSHTYVVTPEGRLDFTVSRPLEKLPQSATDYDRPPTGDSFVGLSWSWEPQHDVRVWEGDGPEAEHAVALIADGKEYSLEEVIFNTDEETEGPRGLDYSGSVYVAVDGEPKELAIQVEYDGLVQTAPAEGWNVSDSHGAASALYGTPDGPSRHRLDCGEPTLPARSQLSVDHTANCTVQVSRMPYHEAVGWAGEGKTWLVLEAHPYPGANASWRERTDDWELYGFEGRGTMEYDFAGTKPAEVAPLSDDPDDQSELVIFKADDLADGELTIKGTFPTESISPDHPSAPSSPDVPITWRVNLLR